MTESKIDFTVDWSNRSKLRGPGDGSLGELLRKLRDRLSPHSKGIAISYVDDRIMKKLNREHRGMDKTTDVLSFPSEAEKGAFPHLGDIVISLPVAEKLAKKLASSRRRVVETLLIHGFLHLCGLDHEKDAGEMMKLQADLEKELLEGGPLSLTRRRGRKPGSKLKKLKDGTRVVVTGRAAKALIKKEVDAKSKAKAKAKAVKPAAGAKAGDAVGTRRKPGRPRKVEAAPVSPAARRAPRRRRTPKPRSGVIA